MQTSRYTLHPLAHGASIASRARVQIDPSIVGRAGRLALILLACLFTACFGRSVSHFTASAIATYSLSIDDLKRIQFYNSHTIVLTADEARRESSVSAKHGMRITGATYIDKIIIKKNTPGIVVEVGDYWLRVSFEPDRTLRFVTLNGRYVLESKSVLYGDRYYEVECVENRSENCPPTLKVRGNFETETKTRKRKLSGLIIE